MVLKGPPFIDGVARGEQRRAPFARWFLKGRDLPFECRYEAAYVLANGSSNWRCGALRLVVIERRNRSPQPQRFDAGAG